MCKLQLKAVRLVSNFLKIYKLRAIYGIYTWYITNVQSIYSTWTKSKHLRHSSANIQMLSKLQGIVGLSINDSNLWKYSWKQLIFHLQNILRLYMLFWVIDYIAGYLCLRNIIYVIKIRTIMTISQHKFSKLQGISWSLLGGESCFAFFAFFFCVEFCLSFAVAAPFSRSFWLSLCLHDQQE